MYFVPDKDLRDYLLDDLTELFLKNGSRIGDFNLPKKSSASHSISGNRLIDEELA